MASDAAVADAVKRVFASATLTAGAAEFDTYAGALSDITDGDLDRGVDLLVREETWEDRRRPSPALVRNYVSRARHAGQWAEPAPIPSEPVTPREELAERLARIRAERFGGER